MKVGIIGSGFGLYGLLPAFNDIPSCKVVAICGKRTDRLTKYCKSIGLTKIYSSWEEMLENEELDGVAIAVMPSAQYAIAKRAMSKGLHVFAEKPLTANISEAKELVLLAKKKKVITAVDFIFPEIKEWQKVKELLDKNIYGKLQHINVVWNFLSYDIKNNIASWKTDIKEGGGALSFYGSHMLHYLEYFGGEILSTKSNFSYSPKSNNGGETGVDILMKYKSGTCGAAHLSCNTPNTPVHRLTFVCEKGTLVLESKKGVTEHFTLTVYKEGNAKKVSVKKTLGKKDEDERVQTVKKLATRFITACKTESQMSPSFIDGLRVQELLEKVRKS